MLILTARLNRKKSFNVEWWEPICYSLIFLVLSHRVSDRLYIKDVHSLKSFITHIIFITLHRELRRPGQSLKNLLVSNKYLTTNTVTLVPLQGSYYLTKKNLKIDRHFFGFLSSLWLNYGSWHKSTLPTHGGTDVNSYSSREFVKICLVARWMCERHDNYKLI